MTHEFLSIYPAKLMEYGLAVLYLLLFIPFWSYVQGGRRTAMRVALLPRPARWAPPRVEVAAGAPVAARLHGAAAARARRRGPVRATRARGPRAHERRMPEP